MKKYSLLSLLLCFLFACSDDKTDMPRIELSNLFLNGEDKDYSRNLKDILPLSAGDYINVSFRLYGNEADLASFVVGNEDSNINARISSYPENEVASDFLPTDDEMLRYKDGIRSTWVEVTLRVRSAKEEEVRPAFYLNSKAPDCEGAVYYLDLTTTAKPRASEEE
ncbi:DUF5035 family protein [Bacteroides sp. 51]|uniref:DUF5035 family protein n=1 Tax=Bacteroides sp. 51 TaxID=2302938 RepID=UPI0013D4C97E|nr:DUF5035 family protein [Bacteroides sp. 51]